MQNYKNTPEQQKHQNAEPNEPETKKVDVVKGKEIEEKPEHEPETPKKPLPPP